jgi:hypothetical protein
MPPASYPTRTRRDLGIPPASGRRRAHIAPGSLWTPEPTFIPTLVATLLLLVTAGLAAWAAPEVLALLTLFNVTIAPWELAGALLAVAIGVALILLLFVSIRAPAAADGRTWAALRLERTLQARQLPAVRRPAGPVVVVPRRGRRRSRRVYEHLPAITPLAFWEQPGDSLPATLTWSVGAYVPPPPRGRYAHDTDESRASKKSSQDYRPLLPMPA